MEYALGFLVLLAFIIIKAKSSGRKEAEGRQAETNLKKSQEIDEMILEQEHEKDDLLDALDKLEPDSLRGKSGNNRETH